MRDKRVQLGGGGDLALVDGADDAVVVEDDDVGVSGVEGDVAHRRRPVDPLRRQVRRQLPRERRVLLRRHVELDDLPRPPGPTTTNRTDGHPRPLPQIPSTTPPQMMIDVALVLFSDPPKRIEREIKQKQKQVASRSSDTISIKLPSNQSWFLKKKINKNWIKN